MWYIENPCKSLRDRLRRQFCIQPYRLKDEVLPIRVYHRFRWVSKSKILRCQCNDCFTLRHHLASGDEQARQSKRTHEERERKYKKAAKANAAKEKVKRADLAFRMIQAIPVVEGQNPLVISTADYSVPLFGVRRRLYEWKEKKRRAKAEQEKRKGKTERSDTSPGTSTSEETEATARAETMAYLKSIEVEDRRLRAHRNAPWIHPHAGTLPGSTNLLLKPQERAIGPSSNDVVPRIPDDAVRRLGHPFVFVPKIRPLGVPLPPCGGPETKPPSNQPRGLDSRDPWVSSSVASKLKTRSDKVREFPDGSLLIKVGNRSSFPVATVRARPRSSPGLLPSGKSMEVPLTRASARTMTEAPVHEASVQISTTELGRPLSESLNAALDTIADSC